MMDKLKVLSLLLLAACIWGNPLEKVEPTGEQSAETEVEESDGSGDEKSELQKREKVPRLPNIGYLFQGYNIIKGNPLDPSGSDPGFTRYNIFEAEEEENRKTYDGRYKMPDHTDGTQQESCSMTASSETMNTQKQYKDTLNVKASASVSGGTAVWSASFSASTEYNRVSEQLKTNEKSVIKSESTCTLYGAAMHTNPPPKFTENFFNNLKALGNENPDYATFLDTFGTHFLGTITMGARFSKIQTISKENQEKLQKEGIDVDVTASASLIGKVDVEVSTSVSTTKEDIEKFSNSIEETKLVTFGSKLPPDGSPETWMASAIKNPYPIQYKLRSILDLFKPAYFTNTPEVNYKEIRAGLQNFLQGYCKNYAGRHPTLKNIECEGPPTGCGGGRICSANAICEELAAGGASTITDQQYKCKCKKGFKGDGTRCDRVFKWIAKGAIHHIHMRGPWGTWGGMQYCPNGVFADGFIIRAQQPSNDDETGANAVCITCKDQYVCSKEASWGAWSEEYKCPKGSFLYAWRQNVERERDATDQSALDNVEYKCKNMDTREVTKTMKGNGYEWGIWSRFKGCPANQFICGINTKVEDPNSDDSALNDIQHECCEMTISKKKAKKKKHQKEIK